MSVKLCAVRFVEKTSTRIEHDDSGEKKRETDPATKLTSARNINKVFATNHIYKQTYPGQQ